MQLVVVSFTGIFVDTTATDIGIETSYFTDGQHYYITILEDIVHIFVQAKMQTVLSENVQ